MFWVWNSLISCACCLASAGAALYQHNSFAAVGWAVAALWALSSFIANLREAA